MALTRVYRSAALAGPPQQHTVKMRSATAAV
eukprot:COSAG03_NODE_7683_length_884_cov_16.175796_2_plen_30_part_01